MSDVNETGGETQRESNRYTADARRRIEQLRAVADEFPDETDGAPLTPMEVRLARHTPIEALEKAAIFADVVPHDTGIDVAELRDVIAFELAYTGVVGEAKSSARRIEHAILRRKLKAVKAVRALYRVAKGYVTFDAGDAYRPYVENLKQTLVRPRRRKSTPPPAEEP